MESSEGGPEFQNQNTSAMSSNAGKDTQNLLSREGGTKIHCAVEGKQDRASVLYKIETGYGTLQVYPATSSSDTVSGTSGIRESKKKNSYGGMSVSSPVLSADYVNEEQTLSIDNLVHEDDVPLVNMHRQQLQKSVSPDDLQAAWADNTTSEGGPPVHDSCMDGDPNNRRIITPNAPDDGTGGLCSVVCYVKSPTRVEFGSTTSSTTCDFLDAGNEGTQQCVRRTSWRECNNVKFVPLSSSSAATSIMERSLEDEGGSEYEVPNCFISQLRTDVEAAFPRRLGCEKRPYNFVNRNKRVKAPEHVVHRKLSLKEILKVRGMWCCKSKMCCSKVSIGAIRDVRLEFYQLHFEARQKWWMDCLKRFTVLVNGREIVRPVVDKTTICCAAWCNVVGVHRKTVSRKILKARAGAVRPEHGLRGSVKFSNDYVTIASLTKTFIDNHADQMPDETVMNSVGEVRVKLKLPASYNKKGIYDELKTDRASTGQLTGSLYTFYKVWRSEFWHVDITKSNDFTKCAQCVEFKQYINSAATDRIRESFKRGRATHNHLQFAHRLNYTLWKEESIKRPQESLCLIIDGMDQAKTSVPHMARTFYSKDLMSHHMMKTNLTGILAHGRKPSIYIHSWFPFFPHDSNSVISSIMKVLRSMQGFGERLPPILRLQADNCWRENKNRFVFSFLSLLVKFQIFKEVEMGFMIVGHTHTDVDAMFSVISRKLKERNAYTIEHLHTLVRSSHKDPSLTECSVIDEVANFREAVLPYLVSGPDRIVGHIHPHLFRFYMLDDNPVMQYKEFCNDIAWKPETEPIHWFLRDAEGRYAGPTSIDDFVIKPVQPQSLKDLESGKLGVRKWLEVMDKERRHWDVLQERVRKIKEDACGTWRKFLVDSEITCDPVKAPTDLAQGFWPKQSPFTVNVEDDNVAFGDSVRQPTYCGPKRLAPLKPLAPLPEFDPYIDVHKGDFVIMRPDKKESKEGVPFWVGEALTEIVADEESENHNKFLYDYWIPCGRKGLSNTELYANAWECNWKRWGNADWQPALSIVWSWKKKSPRV
jgi:hypothetical protein